MTELQDFERQAIELLLAGEHPVLDILRQQFEGARVASREASELGSLVNFRLSRRAPRAEDRTHFQLLDVFGRLEGTGREVGFILFVEDGLLARLECYTEDGAWPENGRPEKLYYKHPQAPGSAKLVEAEARDLVWVLGGENDQETVDLKAVLTGRRLARPSRSPASEDTEEVGGMSQNPVREDPEATQRIGAPGIEMLREMSEPHVLSAKRRLWLVGFTVAVAVGGLIALVLLTAYAWYLPPDKTLDTLDEALRRYVLTSTLTTMLVAGALGGALANLWEFFHMGRHQDGFPVRLEIPFYLRPLSAAVLGVLTFFLTNFFIAVWSVGSTTQGWALMHGRLAYVALAFLSGFGVQVVLDKLKEVAAALLGNH